MKKVNIAGYISPEDYEKILTDKVTGDYELENIGTAFDELRDFKFDEIKTAFYFDKNKVFVRGAVTRIGAYSNIGKSKFAYWVESMMLKQGYAGIHFSTEVVTPLVLANLVSILDGVGFGKVTSKMHIPSTNCRKSLSRLQIYDSQRGSLYLENIKDYIIANGEKAIDFIVIDFCQSVYDYQRNSKDYERLSNYALELQQLAQKFNICIIDLSQLANDSVKNDYKESGFVAYKGSGGLYASADIGIQLNRNKVDSPNLMICEIRKHKFYKTSDISFDVDFATGMFTLDNLNYVKENKTSKLKL